VERSIDGATGAGRPRAIAHSRIVSRTPFYYGWVILVAAIIGRIMTSPGQTYSISIFIEHFIADLGISRSMVSSLYTVGTLAGALALPFVGRQIDRRGPRVVVGVTVVLLAVACIYMRFVNGAVMLGIGFVLLRMLGQGSLSMVSTNIVNQWWVRRRGAILGIAAVSSALLGSGLFPSIVNSLIGRFGWRTSYVLLGLMVAAVMLPVGLLFFRRQPEDYGLLPDGLSRPKGDVEAEDAAPAEENWTQAEAVRTPAFWIINLGLASISMLGTGLQFHMVSVFADAGLSSDVAAAAFLPIAAVNAVVALIAGVLVDRVSARYMLFAALLGQATSLVMAPRLQGVPSALGYGAVLGFTSALQMTVGSVVWAKYFGRRHLGSITGAASVITIGGSALGPMPMGIARDLLGSYTVALTAAAALPLALGIVALFARQPRKATTG